MVREVSQDRPRGPSAAEAAVAREPGEQGPSPVPDLGLRLAWAGLSHFHLPSLHLRFN